MNFVNDRLEVLMGEKPWQADINPMALLYMILSKKDDSTQIKLIEKFPSILRNLAANTEYLNEIHKFVYRKNYRPPHPKGL